MATKKTDDEKQDQTEDTEQHDDAADKDDHPASKGTNKERLEALEEQVAELRRVSGLRD